MFPRTAAPTFVIDHMLVDAETLPEQNGPAGWGIPKPFRWRWSFTPNV